MIQRDKARRALAVVEAERDQLRAELDEAHAIIRELTATLRDVQDRPGRTAKVIRQGTPVHSYSEWPQNAETATDTWHESE
jgi:hypothetical protein